MPEAEIPKHLKKNKPLEVKSNKLCNKNIGTMELEKAMKLIFSKIALNFKTLKFRSTGNGGTRRI